MGFNFPDCPLPPGSSVWAYLRDSGGETQDLSSQRAYVLAYSQHHRLHITRWFEDGAISGGAVAGRDEFELMVELSRLDKKPAVDGIVYWDIKRFARNVLDSQYYKADLRRRGYRLISISDNIPDNEFAIVFEAFLEWKAQKDREDIAKDTKRGLRFIIELQDDQGHYLGIAPGKPPTCFRGERYDTGLRRNNGQPRITQRWVPDESTWDKGRRAWEMRAERASYDEIRRETGLFTSAINTGSVCHSFFKNEIYLGRFHYGGQVYENFVPPLTTPDIWEQVRKLDYRKPAKGQPFPADKTHPKAGRSEEYLLSGLCNCMFCQSAMHGNTNTRSGRTRFWHYYLCARKKARPDECEAKQTSARRLEEAVIEKIGSTVLTIDYVSDLAEQVNEILNDTASLKAAIEESEAKLRELGRAIKNLIDTVEIHPSPDLVGRLRQREAERHTEQVKLERLQQRLRQSVVIDAAVVTTVLTEMRRSLLAGEMQARQKLLQQVIKKIEVGRSCGQLHCRFPVETLTGVWFMPSTGFELNPCQVYKFAF